MSDQVQMPMKSPDKLCKRNLSDLLMIAVSFGLVFAITLSTLVVRHEWPRQDSSAYRRLPAGELQQVQSADRSLKNTSLF
jgi:uncharacterized membrane protein